MRKSNRGQTVGTLSTRGGVHPSQKDVRKKSEESLSMQYMHARVECAKNPNHENRRAVDGLQKRLIRRQKRAIFRAAKARQLQMERRARDGLKALSLAQAAADETHRPAPAAPTS